MSPEPIEEIRVLAGRLNPRAFMSRLAYWRKGDFPAGGMAERVGGSRTPKRPEFDKTDEQLNHAEHDYNLAIEGFRAAMSAGDHKKALGELRKAEVLERIWLVPIDVLPPEQLKAMNALVSDAQSCATCEDTKEAWVRRQKKKGVRSPIWRMKVSPDGMPDCAACYAKKRRARLAALEPEIAAAS